MEPGSASGSCQAASQSPLFKSCLPPRPNAERKRQLELQASPFFFAARAACTPFVRRPAPCLKNASLRQSQGDPTPRNVTFGVPCCVFRGGRFSVFAIECDGCEVRGAAQMRTRYTAQRFFLHMSPHVTWLNHRHQVGQMRLRCVGVGGKQG